MKNQTSSQRILLAGMIVTRGLLTAAMLLARIAGMAQEFASQPHITPQAQSQSSPDQNPAPSASIPPAPAKIIVPPGTRIALGLLRPLSFKHTKPGDPAYLQATFPVSAGNQMVIPPGTYVQGVIANITARDRSKRIMRFDLRSASVIFSTGYTVTIPGPLNVEPSVAMAGPFSPFPGASVPVLAAAGGVTPPTLPPLPHVGPSPGTLAAIGVAGVAATVVVAVLVAHNRDLSMPVGSPVEITLAAPLELEGDRLAAAIHDYAMKAAIAPPQIVQPPKRMKTCWTDGTPGTPDTVIPGTPDTVIPGTPPTTIPGDPPTTIPGTPPTVIPGTPPTVIPGTPGTPGTSYPCPE